LLYLLTLFIALWGKPQNPKIPPEEQHISTKADNCLISTLWCQ